ncbi:angiopoietin-related protein 7 [Drosophila innubila]|uniref:angiopoietin-related protein 7 n=1 Tax=Drosophila innubila TaxID=198719 RepID=UPI00148DDA36|nr:angiopoietin-related protein 7 [Drosophila innubila]
MGSISMRLVCAIIFAVICVNHPVIWALAQQEVGNTGVNSTQSQSPSKPQSPPQSQQHWRYHARGNQRHNTALSATPAPQHSEIKELMTNLHDRVGVLATLDEDQRNRLEVIDKKIDQLLESSTGRMESLKVQQLNFQQRLDSFEHIQRLTRSTLDELKGETDVYLGSRVARQLRQKQKNREKLKDLSRQTRQVTEPPPHVAENMAAIFNRQPAAAAAVFNGTQLDINGRLDALATLLVSLAYSVKETQQNTNIIKRRLAHRGKGQSARLPQTSVASPVTVDEQATSCLQSYLAVKGILRLQLTPESESFYVPCEGDGWTVIMKRSSDDLSFERSWLEYKEGFGNLAGDFFIGLDKLHALTSSVLHELRIVLEDFEGNVAYAEYNAFAISGEREFYTLHLLGQFQNQVAPTAGDSLSYHAGAKFSTFDSDNDNCLECNCAQRLKAAGWFNNCGTSNLMGVYHAQNPSKAGETGIFWDTFQGKDYSLRSVKMLIRPVAQDEARR